MRAVCEADITCSALKVDDTADADALLEKAAAALEAAGHGEKTAARERRLEECDALLDDSYFYNGGAAARDAEADAEAALSQSAKEIKLLHTYCDFSDPSVSEAEALAACEALLKECGDDPSSSPSPFPFERRLDEDWDDSYMYNVMLEDAEEALSQKAKELKLLHAFCDLSPSPSPDPSPSPSPESSPSPSPESSPLASPESSPSPSPEASPSPSPSPEASSSPEFLAACEARFKECGLKPSASPSPDPFDF